jgi:hypothetical protein
MSAEEKCVHKNRKIRHAREWDEYIEEQHEWRKARNANWSEPESDYCSHDIKKVTEELDFAMNVDMPRDLLDIIVEYLSPCLLSYSPFFHETTVNHTYKIQGNEDSKICPLVWQCRQCYNIIPIKKPI